MNPHEVVVVGGGPAGAAAAIGLARAGVAVTVVDRAHFPRDKCCGDGLTTGCLRRLDDLGLDPASVPSFFAIDTLMASSPSGRIVRVPLSPADGTFAAVARRTDLDAALLGLARSAGANVVEGDGVTGIVEEHDGATVTLTSGSTRRASVVLAADGARSTVRRLVRAAGPGDTGDHTGGDTGDRTGQLAGRDAWFAYRQYAHNVSEQAANELWVRFDPALVPGYGWSFPLGDGRANVGIGLPRQHGTPGRELREAWNNTLGSTFFTSLLGEGAALDGSVRAWPIPTGVRAIDLAAWDGKVLFLGDAAATADPFTGEGIAQALESGSLAATAVINDGPERAARRYVAGVGKSLFTEQRISRATRALLSSPLGARAALRGTALAPWVASIVGRWLYEEYPRTVVTRPRTWSQVPHPRPGAFAGRSVPVAR